MNAAGFARWVVQAHADGARLLTDAERLAARLPAATDGSEIAYAFEDDRESFAIALLATWLAGHVAAIPNDASRHSVGPLLARANHAGFLHDTGVGRGIDVPKVRADPGEDRGVDADSGPILVRTFAPESAEPLREWSADQLVDIVMRTRGKLELSAREAVLCSFAPTPWASLLYGLLAPLHAGAPLLARCSDFARAASSAAASLLVASPEHARALPASVRSQRRVHVVEHDDAPWRPLAREIERSAIMVDGVADACAIPHPTVPDTWLVAFEHPDDHAALDAVRSALTERLPNTPFELVGQRALPRDTSGRMSDADLYLRFGLGRDGAEVEHALRLDPLPAAPDDEATTRRFRTRIPERYAAFEGHFDGHPILAGAVQLDRIVLPTLRRAWDDAASIQGLSRVKFAHRIDPGDTIEVVLRRTKPDRVSFSIEREGVSCSSGVLTLESPPATEPEPS